MINQVGEAVRSGARGEFGGLVLIRPTTGRLVVCLHGHRLELYGMLKPYSHRYRLHGTLCEVCRAQGGQRTRVPPPCRVGAPRRHGSALGRHGSG